MHILLTNDDGPLDDASCPYFKYFVDEVLRSTDWKLSICIPNVQRSWIGKAHFAGKSLTRTFLYTQDSTAAPNDAVNAFDGPYTEPQDRPGQEWNLIDSTPAACTDIGINHLFEDVDLVVSGPNFGKNSSNLYILTSGTVGAAMEATLHGKKAVALSYSYTQKDHPFEQIKEASRLAVRVIRKLVGEFDAHPDVDLYTVNVPLNESLDVRSTKVFYAPIFENKWQHSVYEKVDTTHFEWSPNFKAVYKDGLGNFDHSDNRVLLNNNISVTPLRTKFKEVEPFFGELHLDDAPAAPAPKQYLLISIPQTEYIYAPIVEAFEAQGFEVTADAAVLKQIPDVQVFHYAEYEDLDLDLVQSHPQHYFIPVYIYRKALIRKHYLSNTVHHYAVKHPKSALHAGFPPTYTFELDYAEFLDDALDECYELRDEVQNSDKLWILKPSMSDKGQGIRLFRTIDQLQAIFDSFEEDEDDEEDETGIITSQLRHFVVQEYQQHPLLLEEYNNRKFHFRVYVVANGSLEVYVYKHILTLFAAEPFSIVDDNGIQMAGHLTNTCLQDEEPLVVPFWDLKGINQFQKQQLFSKICELVSETFLAAASVDKINFQPLANATEIFGVDFIVDEHLDVQLLEINAYPDFKQTGPQLKKLISQLFRSTAGEVVRENMQGRHRVPQNSHLVEVLRHQR